MEFLYPPLVGAVIGYITNWLAIKMLFKPYYPIKIGGIKVPFTPGVIPKERNRIATNIGQAVGKHLLTDTAIKKKLLDEQTKENVARMIVGGVIQDKIQLECTLKNLLKEDYDAKIGLIEQWIADNLYEYLNDANTQEKMVNQMTHYLKESIYPKPLKTVLPHEIQEVIGSIIEQKMPDIILGIKKVKDSELIEVKVKEMIQSFIEEKLGSLGAMFVKPDAIYSALMNKLDEQLDSEEMALWIESQIKGFIFSMKDKSLEEILANENADYFLEVLGNQLKVLMPNVFTKAEVSVMVQGIMSHMLTKEIIITQEMKSFVEGFVVTKYEKIIDEHMTSMMKSFNLSGIVESEMNTLDIQEIEEILLLIVKKELKAITWFGALLGFIMGIVLNFV